MRGFGKRNDPLDELGRELRRRRPAPREEFLASQIERIGSSRPEERRGITMRSRLVLAVVTTGLLCVAAGATGGLGYARTATSHTVRAVAHVFTAENTRSQHVTAAAAQSQQQDGQQQQQSQDANRGRSDDGDQGDDNASNGNFGNGFGFDRHHGRHNPADHQYGKFVFVCLRVPPKHPVVFITLRLPREAAERLIARGVATPGPC